MSLRPGPRNLITDVDGLVVGNADDAALKSGVTVLTGGKPFVAGVHVMGGAPGSRETDMLAPDKSVKEIDALVLSGGSAFGLDACSGVVDRLHAAGRGIAVGPARIPLVPGAILFDLVNGGDKDWMENPYRSLGHAAFDAAAPIFPLGTVGAGAGALTAQHKGGLGSASFVLPTGETVGALVAANPFGSATPPGSRHFWAAPLEVDGEFGGIGPDPRAGLHTPDPSRKAAVLDPADAAVDGGNTTIAIVATDAPLTKAQCHRLAVAAHDGMARSIMPSHTTVDGDIVFAVSTGTTPGDGVDPVTLAFLGNAAANCLARAIARAVFAATPAPGDLLPCWSEAT